MAPKKQDASTWEGAKPNAWGILALYFSLGAVVGFAGYWGVLVKQIQALPHIASMDQQPSRLVLALAVVATFFLKTAYVWAADRKGRGLSLFSLAVFPLATAICETFLLLFVFDAGRRARGPVRSAASLWACSALWHLP